MEIIRGLCEDLVKLDPWKYREYINMLPGTVDETKTIYELLAPWENRVGIRCRKVFWTDKSGRKKSCEITTTAIIFNGG